MPTIIPTDQSKNVPVSVTLQNRGSKEVNANLSVTVAGRPVLTKVVNNLTANAEAVVDFDLNLSSIDEGSAADIVINASIIGGEDIDMSNNTINASVLKSSNILAYDNTDINSQSGVGLDVDSYGFGTVMHINTATPLIGIEAAWSNFPAGASINAVVLKWDAATQFYGETVIEGSFPITSRNQWDRYEFDENVTLQPGDYLVVIEATAAGTYILTDMAPSGSFYLVYLDDSEIYDQSGNGFGTPAIRLVVNNNSASGIDNAEIGGTQISLYPNPASETLSIDGGGEKITEVRIFSTTGALIDNITVNDTCCVYDITALPAGLYVARITTESGVKVANFMVK